MHYVKEQTIMAIKEWPESERPQEKLLEKGANALSDAELLALFIRTGTKGKTAIDIGRELLNSFDGLRGILTADYKNFCTQVGLGPAKFALFQAALEISKRFMDEKLKREGALTRAEDVGEYLIHQMRDKPREIFSIIYLDSKNQIIHYEELFYGTINGAAVYPREVVKSVLARNAASVIVAHNHPSGIAEPSISDQNITRRLKQALNLVDVTLLDHIIVGDGNYCSLAERGLI